MAIASPQNDFDSEENKTGYVSVFHYDRMTMTWNLLGSPIQGSTDGDKFGLGLGQSLKVTPDGRTLVVGVAAYDGVNGTAKNIGQARVYTYDDDVMDWVQVGSGIDGLNPEDGAGDVAINALGNVVAIGAPGYDDGNVTTKSGIGHVRVFSLDNAGSWSQIGTEILGDRNGDNAGPVALDARGEKLFVGIGGFDEPVGSAGAVRAFEFVNGGSTCDPSGKCQVYANGLSLRLEYSTHFC